jgi:hypothetical protein
VSEPVAQKKPKKAKPGRQSKLTPEVAKSIADGVAAGVPSKFAAQRAGVSERSLREWLAKGRKAKSGPHFALSAALKKAEADAISRNTAMVQRAAAERDEVTVKETVTTDANGQTITKRETTTKKVFDWCAAAWWLERRYPDQFGRPNRPEKPPKPDSNASSPNNPAGNSLVILLDGTDVVEPPTEAPDAPDPAGGE